MPICSGFARSRWSRKVWLPCARQAAPRERFCAKHRDEMHGALLCLLRDGDLFQVFPEELICKCGRKRRKRVFSARDTRKAAAATTTPPDGLEPDPARACPAPILSYEDAWKTVLV
jgi:hypothetical protein